jgi:hypothetical protein
MSAQEGPESASKNPKAIHLRVRGIKKSPRFCERLVVPQPLRLG